MKLRIIETKREHYTYILLDPRKSGTYTYGPWTFRFEPFYVGKGKGNRAYHHLKPSSLQSRINPHKNRKIRNILNEGLNYKIRYIERNLTEEEAFLLEKKLIKAIGRHNLGKGPLTNNSSGGEVGNSGWKASESQRKATALCTQRQFRTMTLSEKIRRGIRISKASRNIHASRTLEEKKVLALKISKAKQKAFARMTPEEKKIYGLKLRGRKINRTPEQLARFKQSVSKASKKAYSNMSEAKKKLRNQKIADAIRKVWATRSAAKRKAIQLKAMKNKRNKNGK